MVKYLLAVILIVLYGTLNAQMKMLYDKENAEKEKIEKYLNSGSDSILIYRIDIDEKEKESDTTFLLKIEISRDKKVVKEIGNESTVITELNAEGNIGLREIKDKQGILTGKTVYSYNNKGYIIKRELYLGMIKAGEETYDFRNDNTGTMKFYVSNEMIMSSSAFSFDKDNKLIEEIIFGQDGSVDQKYEYLYDSNGRLAEERVVMNKEQNSFKNYSYDEYDNIVEEISKDGSGKTLSMTRYAYEGKNKIEEVQEGADIKISIKYYYKDGLLDLVKFIDLSDMSVYYWKYIYGR